MKNQSLLYKCFILVCCHLTSVFYNFNKTVFFYCLRDKIQGNNPACIIHTLISGGDMSKFAVRNTKGRSK